MTGEMIYKPWGYELIWAKNDKYAGKILYIKPGQRLSLQYHEKKDESVFVLEGKLLLYTDKDILELESGQSYRITPGMIHRFSAGTEPVKLVEVSTAELDDVVRLEDDYGRKE
tara:strand:- start:110 stop:448 length:339 start_codon:yes stop_codon:yes gene_type:complete